MSPEISEIGPGLLTPRHRQMLELAALERAKQKIVSEQMNEGMAERAHMIVAC